ncbi:hypothetical protein RUM44_009328 [Polyplax serrata]|uniref:Uncharacterized protein n=1 Tax=Polyplax serrata TaxID=468196 RepID=A0ABR1ASC4_POLSC
MDSKETNSAPTDASSNLNESMKRKGTSASMTTSHGVKLPLNVPSQDKEKLIQRFKEWRKEKMEKVLQNKNRNPAAKQPVLLKNKMSTPTLPKLDCNQKGKERESVFDRLYKNEKVGRSVEKSCMKGSPFPKPTPQKLNNWSVTVVVDKSSDQPDFSNDIKDNISNNFVTTVLPSDEANKEIVQSDSTTAFNSVNYDDENKENVLGYLKRINDDLVAPTFDHNDENKKILQSDPTTTHDSVASSMNCDDENKENILSDPARIHHGDLVAHILEYNQEMNEQPSDQPDFTNDLKDNTSNNLVTPVLTSDEENKEILQGGPTTAHDPVAPLMNYDDESETNVQSDMKHLNLEEAQNNDLHLKGDHKNSMLKSIEINKTEMKKGEEIRQVNEPKKGVTYPSGDVTHNKQHDSNVADIENIIPVQGQQSKTSSNKTPFLTPKLNRPKQLVQSKEVIKPKPTVRRSISTIYRKNGGIRRSLSEKNLHEIKSCIHRSAHQAKNVSYSYEDALDKKKNLSVKSIPFASPRPLKGATCKHMRNELEKWLEEKGHPLEGYRHLRCFGISLPPKKLPSPMKQPKQNQVKTVEIPKEENGEYIPPPEASSVECSEPSKADCENWLNELHKLIVELMYPLERCEEWLSAVRIKCPWCTEMPIYWECLAAINSDNKAEVNQNEPSIMTDVEAVASLFDQMVIEQHKPQGGKLDRGLDPKNVFNSTIIKFALKEKNVKERATSDQEEPKTSKSLIATPVRRSSRIQTPVKKKNVVDSLHSLTPDVQKYTFKANESLLQRL